MTGIEGHERILEQNKISDNGKIADELSIKNISSDKQTKANNNYIYDYLMAKMYCHVNLCYASV